jgi:hypothetical protein
MKLPERAVFKVDSAQAHAVVSIRADTLHVEVKCDSLQALVYEYEKIIQGLKEKSETDTKEKNTADITPKDKFSFKWLSIGIVIGFVTLIIILIVIKL